MKTSGTNGIGFTDGICLLRRWCVMAMVVFTTLWCRADGDFCEECNTNIAIKTNLVHDALLTPDLGVELSIARRFSVSVSGVYAWWSNNRRHSYWRIRGGVLEARCWFGDRSRARALTGHHVGVYGSAHDYDFEFGGTGWQSPRAVYGVGVGYGYSFRLNRRLNLDLGMRVGYSAGRRIKYKPECGDYVCVGRTFARYIGVTGIDITLVWFPGAKNRNNPSLGL